MIRVEQFSQRQSFTEPLLTGVTSVAVAVQPYVEQRYRNLLVQTPTSDTTVLRSFKRDIVHTTIKHAKPSRTHWVSIAGERTKRHMLDAHDDVALLRVLDLASADGTILSAMADKFRQVNHLCAQWMPQLRSLAAQQPGRSLSIVDAGCGKAYMSLALMYLLRREGIASELHGVDSNPHVIEHCRNAASQLELASTTFSCGPIGSLSQPTACDVVIALHACDTATDDALALALRLQASLMIIAPCCHHYVQQQLRSDRVPEAARPLLDDASRRSAWEIFSPIAFDVMCCVPTDSTHTSKSLSHSSTRRRMCYFVPRASNATNATSSDGLIAFVRHARRGEYNLAFARW
jgi:2-polyprenyl-3-methyl-5-hydroxy-6-metoxy-1,4-benzoquinol methylase